MILDAVPQDEVAVITLLRQSHGAAGFHRDDGGFSFAFDPAYAQRLFMAHLIAPAAICLVLKPSAEDPARGVLMACEAEHPFGAVRMARETVWFIDPLYRGSSAMRMLDQYERWANQRGCQFAGMAGMGDDPDVAKLYRRRGYQAAETHFLKAF
jgi:hypothetical protein